MPAKSAKTSGYLYMFYGGIIKLGNIYAGYIEDGDIEEHLETYKQFYGNKVKGRYVKSSAPKDHFDSLTEKFNEFSEGDNVFKVNTTNFVNGLREVSGSKTSKTWNVYPGTEEEGEEKNEVEEKEEEKPKKEATKKKATAKKVEEEVEEDAEEEAEEEEEEKPKKAPSKKAPAKKATAKKVEEEDKEEEEVEEEEEKKPAKKAPAKKVAKK